MKTEHWVASRQSLGCAFRCHHPFLPSQLSKFIEFNLKSHNFCTHTNYSCKTLCIDWRNLLRHMKSYCCFSTYLCKYQGKCVYFIRNLQITANFAESCARGSPRFLCKTNTTNKQCWVTIFLGMLFTWSLGMMSHNTCNKLTRNQHKGDRSHATHHLLVCVPYQLVIHALPLLHPLYASDDQTSKNCFLTESSWKTP